MRVVVISSCTGEKTVQDENALTLEDFATTKKHLRERERELKGLMVKAEDLYSGQQHVRLMRGVSTFREANPTNGSGPPLELFILSAGYGLVSGAKKLAPYETTFTGMKAKELRSWADQLKIPQAFRETLAEPYDLALILLGDSYIRACDIDADLTLGGPTILFCGGRMAEKLPKLKQLKVVPLSNEHAKRFSCGLVGLKGELMDRLLTKLVEKPDLLEKLATTSPKQLLKKLEGPAKKKAQKRAKKEVEKPAKKKAEKPAKRKGPIAKPDVDYVVSVPKRWTKDSNRRRLRYFIPEWDDLVDRDYDFDQDGHSGGSGDWSNEVYAHQMYPEPNYDGLLVSKVVAEKSKRKKERINRMGVHRFLRVPREYPVMGDCGAFGYISEKVPPYTTPEILDYYSRLDFDYGVSIDHLIVSSTAEEKQDRYQLTIQNAEDFLTEHKAQQLPWTPIGAVQGWDPESYAKAASAYVKMGYKYIALGGLVRSTTKDVLSVLEEVHKVVPSHVDVHLFGLSRIQSMRQFADLGVTSVDSASLLRRAWMGTGQNYLSIDGSFYAAIRVPESGKSFRAKRMVSEGRATQEQVSGLDRACIDALQRFDRGHASVDEVLNVVTEYDRLVTPDREDNTKVLRAVLEDKPWRKCPCDICRKDGIHVAIFRGNNRNRRRGFHNTYVFYRLLERALNGEFISFSSKKRPGVQLGLPGVLEKAEHAL